MSEGFVDDADYMMIIREYVDEEDIQEAKDNGTLDKEDADDDKSI